MHPYDRVLIGLLFVFIALVAAELARWLRNRQR
jgi:hypothetical protein